MTAPGPSPSPRLASSAVVIGLGQLGATFAEGWLRAGRAVVPVTRRAPLADLPRELPQPSIVLLGVGEHSLPAVLRGLPPAYAERCALLQNELLPWVWQESLGAAAAGPSGAESAGAEPSVAVVWFEKKAGKPIHSIRPSVLFGPVSSYLAEALSALELPFFEAQDSQQRDFELVLKNLYILTLNLAGLEVGGSAGELWRDHAQLSHPLCRELICLQESLLGRKLDESALLAGVESAILADPQHAARGRTAEERLRRAAAQALAAGLELPRLSGLARAINAP